MTITALITGGTSGIGRAAAKKFFQNYRIAHTAWRRSASNTLNLGE
jgi:NAD(P)-dependent dehydrogenase (short-subunit alcohol dehydrogenase family)